MTIQLQKPDITELKPRISVFGVGGGGGNAVNNMINAGLQGVEFVVANTDAQALTMSRAERRIQLGVNATDGLGAGSHPEIGREAAEECLDEIMDHLGSSHMVFVTAGMGGGTGTGAAPVIARAAREKGILTVGVVTKPFHFEGQRRMKTAETGIEELQKNVDTLIVIPNQNLFRIATEQTTFADAFSMADQVLYSGVASITDLMVHEGLVNLDFADVRSVMQKMGKAMMGTGEASAGGRALAAAEAAIANPLLDETSMRGARGLLISITGGRDMTLFEVDEAANRIREEVDPDANVIFGAIIDEALEGIIRVSVVATGIDARAADMADGSALGNHAAAAEQAALRREAAAPLLKKESAAVMAAESAEDYESEAEDLEERAAEAGYADAAPRDNGAVSRIFAPAARQNFAAGRPDSAAAEAPAEIAAEENAAGGFASPPLQGQAQMQAARPAYDSAAAPHGGSVMAGAAAPRPNGQFAERRPQAEQGGRAGFNTRGMEDFPDALRQTLQQGNRGGRAESANVPRGFLKKLQNFFSGSDDAAARLEPAEEEPESEAGFNGRIESRMTQREAAFAEMPRQPSVRPANIGRNAPQQRPETTLYSAPRAPARLTMADEKEEEKLEIPAFLRRQSR